MYTLLYMSTRTQIYLSESQRKLIAELSRQSGKTLAAIVREALDAYLPSQRPTPESALEATFGAAAKFEVPSRAEWKQRG